MKNKFRIELIVLFFPHDFRVNPTFILDCAASKVPEILRQAQQLKLTSPYYQYLLTTLVRDFSCGL